MEIQAAPDIGIRHHCRFDGCDKSFIRKEHLNRHERIHAGSHFVCEICSEKFHRSDSLRRHLLTRHSDVFKPTPSSKTKKACTACHKRKVKCDGSQPCSRCREKKDNCIYEQSETVAPSEDHPVGERSQPQNSSSLGATGNHDTNMLDAFSGGVQHEAATHIDAPGVNESFGMNIDDSFLAEAHRQQEQALQPATVSPNESSGSGISPPQNQQATSSPFDQFIFKTAGVVNWSALRIQKDRQSNGEMPSEQPPAMSGDADDNYLETVFKAYFGHFHHRWPIVHRPAYEDQKFSLVLISSMKMIGAWFLLDQRSHDNAFAMHEYLMLHIPSILAKKSSNDRFHDTLPVSLCQAALLNIVFALYCGIEKLVSRAVTLHNMLVGVLREVRFFEKETAYADEKPGMFLPLHVKMSGDRQRFAMYLYKLDNYLSLIRDRPPLLLPEELHFSLPSSLAHWDADGLGMWEKRLSAESVRDKRSMTELIRTNTDSLNPTGELQLIEDAQLCMCSLQFRIWMLAQVSRTSSSSDPANVYPRDSLQRRLDAFKGQLDRMALRPGDAAHHSQNPNSIFRFYYGYEDQSQPGWETIVTSRVKDLSFDALMLHHLLNLNLHADIRSLRQLARDQGITDVSGLSKDRQFLHAQRMRVAASWSKSASARRCLFSAVSVMTHQCLERSGTVHKRAIDPIAQVALATSALIIWAYCTFSAPRCQLCMPIINDSPSLSVELTNWCGPLVGDMGKDGWIIVGKGCPVDLEGIRLCRCNIGILVAKFQVHIQEGWELAQTIAPGVFANNNSPRRQGHIIPH
ncbi:hypothetical protein B0J14DRAFT_493611 [Halenospora varia]|nr:hypothetical protein B0J14DRAFT_493611 [Halenospora varia]